MPNSQQLGDFFAAAGGSPVNRPALNAFVANSQARNGLLSEQTQEAMVKASQAQEEQAAYARIPQELMDMNPGMKQSEAVLARDFMVRSMDSETALKSIARLKLMYGNPQEQVQGHQGFSGALATPPTVPANYLAVPGTPGTPGAPAYAGATVQQTPNEQAVTSNLQAEAELHKNQAEHPELFHQGIGQGHLDPVMAAEAAEFIRQNPGLAGNFRSLLANGGPDVIHAFLHPSGAPTTPLNGISPAPGVSLKEQAGIRSDFANGLGARQTTALNTMVQHSQLFDAVADQLGNGDFAPSNYVNVLWQRLFGSPAPSNLKTAGAFLGREAVRATVNSGAGTGEERELQVDATSSPDALHGAAATLRSLAAGQFHSLDLRAQRGGVDIAQLLGPEAQAVFGRHPVVPMAPLGAPGDNNSHAGLPSYPDEESARAAGHKDGERVIIGGQAGTLGP